MSYLVHAIIYLCRLLLFICAGLTSDFKNPSDILSYCIHLAYNKLNNKFCQQIIFFCVTVVTIQSMEVKISLHIPSFNSIHSSFEVKTTFVYTKNIWQILLHIRTQCHNMSHLSLLTFVNDLSWCAG